MASYLLITALVLLAAAPLILGQNQGHDCSYMEEIPRPERPDDWPPLNLDGYTWAQRPILPAPDRLDLCMDQYYPGTATTGTQLIYMDEEREGEVAIAKLNYVGAEEPEMIFMSGRNTLLGAEFRRNDAGEWYIYVTQRQDYEEGMVFYSFTVRVPGQTLVPTVALTIVNIDDNEPWLHILQPCVVPELGEARLTECVYELSDADGQLSTSQMTFAIESDRGDDEIFYIDGELVPGNWFSMKLTIGITRPLDFVQNALHIFTVQALDSLPNVGQASLMVQVENVEHRPPRWVEIFAVQQYNEKEARDFTLEAIDADTAILKPIIYEIVTEEEDEEFFSITTITGGHSGAILHVAAIDRDELQREIFRVTVIAYKEDRRDLYIEANIVIIIDDINDQYPKPNQTSYHVEIPEETPFTINFGNQNFHFHDIDLGDNAQYDLELVSVFPPGVAEAFYIAPQVGYQAQSFIMGTVDHARLDYEDEDYQHIEILVVATDRLDPRLQGSTTVYIDLTNWNDEEPIFEETNYTVSFDETEGAGFYVATVLAEDRDIDDKVVHSLMGNAGEYLSIDEDTGEIRVSIDDAFDYHRQNELFVQVRAVDTLGNGPHHTATTQLVIQLNDINNTPPSLRLPRGSPHVEENVPEGYVITRDIWATDPDTIARLRFEIDWETSYATKQGRETPTSEFYDCVEIITVHAEGNTGFAHGHLIVKEIRHNVTLDFEEFEVLYLTVRVVDETTEIGVDFDEMTFTVIIIDMNDNWPIWAEGTLAQEFRVRENSTSNVVIGSVLATDIDGPLYNQVRYTITPTRNTPEDLVKIDFYTGQLTVDREFSIDADIPPRENLYYIVTASDQCYEDDPEDCPDDPTSWDTDGEIAIYIIDTNNKVPQAETDRFLSEVEISEDAGQNHTVVQLYASDQDRDDIYHTVRYQINYVVDPGLRRFFAVDVDTGWVYVDFTTDEVLDRDGDEPRHKIFINLIDNLYSEGEGAPNIVQIEIDVILLDVNDNAPELPSPEQHRWETSEGLTQGTVVLPRIHAHDRDEIFTDNSRVSYEVIDLRPKDREIEVPRLFDIVTLEPTPNWEFYGELVTAMDLRGYWGTYDIHIRAYDHGDPMQESFEWYELVIEPYNFHAPEFVFPQPGTTVRLSKERSANGPLITVGDAFLDTLYATDEDGLDAGIVDFSVVGNADAVQYFEVDNIGDNRGELRLRQTFEEPVREFQVTIRATDRGTVPQALWSESVLNVVFVPSLMDPFFETTTTTVAFFEEEVDGERHTLPPAVDLKNHQCTDDCYPIFYRILDGNNGGHFELDANTNTLRVVRALNREEALTHQLTIAASNSPGVAATQGATLAVTVNVREANPRPVFQRPLYTAGISTQDVIGRELLIVQATHSENAPITYSIDFSSMRVDSSLESVRDSAFVLNPTSGALTLTIQPTAAMHGMFEFDVIATDQAEAYDTAEVKVYLISSMNRVTFTFVNTVEEIESNRDFIAETFSTGFNMICNIDQITPAPDASGAARPDQTQALAHFIRDDVPVSGDEIEIIRDDTQLLFAIQMALRDHDLQLLDFVTELSPDPGSDTSLITIYVLAALSAALAFLCLLLLLTFFIRTRALNRRLEALSMTKYGSVDSGLNRAGLAAPGTNKHATEGSNPIWNETLKAPDFDAISDTSNDSDLIGIEDLPQFRNDYYPSNDNDSFGAIYDPARDTVPNHSNNFGFKTSPFSTNFHDQFRRN